MDVLNLVDGRPVVDADEEIFLLYAALNQAKSLVGLGHIDSRKDTIAVQFEFHPPSPGKKKKKTGPIEIEIEIAQDPTALRSRRGDTGSVVWRASTELARVILRQHFFTPELPIFNPDRLRESNCLELGAGTGLFGIALAPLVRTYTITDIKPLLSLIRKNVTLNSPGWHREPLANVTVEELDWLMLTSIASTTARARYRPVPNVVSDDPAWDLVFVVDCIYNPSLLHPLVDTIDTVSTAGRTWVLVVAELRQEDVLREFLDLWLKLADGKWEITQIQGLLGVHFVVWAGRKRR